MISAVLSGALLAQSPATTLRVGSRSALLVSPGKAAKSSRPPLIVLLHGYGGNPTWLNNYTGFGTVARDAGYLLLTPEGTGSPLGWNSKIMDLGKPGTDDLDFLRKLIDRVIREHRADPRRIFLAGHSNGAMMAARLAATGKPRVRAIATVGGILGVGAPGQETRIDPPRHPFCVLKIHGMQDPVIAYSRNSVALVKGIPGTEETKWWAEHVMDRAKPISSQTGRIIVTSYERGKSTVRLVTLLDHGHTWPTQKSGGYAATREIIQFFSSRR